MQEKMTDCLPDRHARHRAVTASATNVVVTAGAGTGKTSLLIDRIVRLLTRRERRLSLTQIVAVTFTNKAAGELKLRVRHRLQLMKELASGTCDESRFREYEIQSIRTLQESFGLTNEELAEISDTAMREVERAHIGTIHSFAGHLLRLYPVEAGVDPSFQEDDGTQFHDHFNHEWEQWVQRELGPDGRRHEVWRQMLSRHTLEDMQELARTLTDELLPSTPDEACLPPQELTPPLRSWITDLEKRGRMLQEKYQKKRKSKSARTRKSPKIECMLHLAVELLSSLSVGNRPQTDGHSPGTELQQPVPAHKLKHWEDKDHEEARELIRVAQAIELSSAESLGEAVQLLSPFAVQCRTSFVEKGLVSFNAMLARARALLRDHPRVRAELKAQYQAIIVDEFQDTDPIQYELILFLAEDEGAEAQNWHDVQPAPGKLFIVGDPKQSIYAFRRADIEAYDTVVRNHILAPEAGGEQHSLQGNFRSHADVLDPVNHCCAALFSDAAVEGVQPDYEPLIPVSSDLSPLSRERVELRLVALKPEDAETEPAGTPEDAEEEDMDAEASGPREDANAEAAGRAEAEALARWLREEVIGKEQLLLGGHSVTIQPCHIAILFRTLAHLQVCLEAFRRYELPCLVDGEKHFYERQEIIDCSHVLRVLMDPCETLGAVGVLRSPYGGCSDVEIESIVQQGLLENWTRESSLKRLPPIFSILHVLREEIQVLPVPEAIQHLFHALPLAELAAASLDGEYALANVLKLRDMMLKLAVRSGLTFREIVRRLEQWVDDPPEEGERTLVEDGFTPQEGGAMRLLSIHKSKGLEFPMVIVAGLHRGTDHRTSKAWMSHDWLTDTVGLRLDRAADVGGMFIETKLAERERAEQARVLYVAMTRAQRRLVLSAALYEKGLDKKGAFLPLIARGLGLDLASMLASANTASQQEYVTPEDVTDNSAVTTTVVPADKPKKKSRTAPSTWKEPLPADARYQRRWAAWMQRMETAQKTPLFCSPTRLLKTAGDTVLSPIPVAPADPPSNKKRTGKPVNPPRTRPASPPVRPDRSALIGTLAHHVLYAWNFATALGDVSAAPDGEPVWPAWIEDCCRTYLPEEWMSELDDVREELHELFAHFVASEPYAQLRQAEILGREIPFAVPWENPREDSPQEDPVCAPIVSSCVMEGVIDVVYRRHKQIWVADYKTHQVDERSLARVVDEQRAQMETYRRAVETALGGPIRAQLIFLRSGRSVEV